MVELQIEFFYVFCLFFNNKMRSLEVKTGMWKFIHAKYIDSQLYWKHPRKIFPPISFSKNHDSLGMGSKFYANFQCDLPLWRFSCRSKNRKACWIAKVCLRIWLWIWEELGLKCRSKVWVIAEMASLCSSKDCRKWATSVCVCWCLCLF